jgi:hypothetical protein
MRWWVEIAAFIEGGTGLIPSGRQASHRAAGRMMRGLMEQQDLRIPRGAHRYIRPAQRIGWGLLRKVWRVNLGETRPALPRQDCSLIMTVASPESLPLREPGGGQDEAGEHGYEGRAACCGERAI